MQKNFYLIFLFLLFGCLSYSQYTDSTNTIFHVKGAVTITNKGISLVPTFTLGKPAAIFNLSMGKKKLFFEPELRFALEGKPWSFLFWWRYKLITDKKFVVTLGAHPALNFKTETIYINGISTKSIITRRYLAGELVPNYYISKYISVGIYYLYSRSLEKDVARNTHFLTLNGNFSTIRVGKDITARFTPQFYYLNQDGKDGFYFTSSLSLVRNKFPLSIQSIINKKIKSGIASNDFVWNVSIIYSFNKKYVEK